MADIEHYIPFCIKHESKVTLKKSGESNEAYFERARNKGFVIDQGEPTFIGLTLTTYRRFSPDATEDDLKGISYSMWKKCMHDAYWNRIQCDRMRNQSVAEVIMDWYWNSGNMGIRGVQKVLGVKADGIIGNGTLSKINSSDSYDLWAHLLSARYEYYESLVKKNPERYKKFFVGWVNRLNEFKYEES